jgi:radical SAM protein (TIGR01212 family)
MNHPWPGGLPFNDYSSHVRRLWGHRVQKLSVDAGFSCPNRDGTLGRSGCAYCSTASFVPAYCDPRHGIGRQVRDGIDFFSRKYAGQEYLVYFQSNSNTYGDPGRLRGLFEEALAVEGVVGLVVGTRPDTLPEAVVKLLAEYAGRTSLTVELGIESTLDASLERMGRGHGFAAVTDACLRLRAAGVAYGGHVILGLPGESPVDCLAHAGRLNALGLSTLKIHHLQIVEGTRWAVVWRESPDGFDLFDVDRYVPLVADFLERLDPSVVVERLCNESPDALLLAPRWGGVKNFALSHRVAAYMESRGMWQGRLFDIIDNKIK